MPTRLRKMRKRKGGRTLGWGQVGQHRKHGAKGGYGKAGLHKHKWSWVVKYAPDYFGGHGFVPPSPRTTLRWANVSDLERIAGPQRSEGATTLDLTTLGIEKLLGAGSLSRPLVVKVSSATKSAKAKVEAAGGKVEEGA